MVEYFSHRCISFTLGCDAYCLRASLTVHKRSGKKSQSVKITTNDRKEKETQKRAPRSTGIESTGVPYRFSSRILLCSLLGHSSRLVKSIYAKALLPRLPPVFTYCYNPIYPLPQVRNSNTSLRDLP